MAAVITSRGHFLGWKLSFDAGLCKVEACGQQRLGNQALYEHETSRREAKRSRHEREYHATKRLLSIYRKVEWHVESSVDNIKETSQAYGNKAM